MSTYRLVPLREGDHFPLTENKTMVKSSLILVFGVAGWLALEPGQARAQQNAPDRPVPSNVLEQEKPKAGAQKPKAAELESQELLAIILGPALARIEPAELAGLAPGAKFEVLTLQQAYTLARLRARTAVAERRALAVGSYNPKTLDDRARRVGADNFDAFRQEYLANDFRGPAPQFFEVLKHRQEVDSARDQAAMAANMRKLFEELLKTEVPAVSRLQVEQVNSYLLISQQSLALSLANYRSAVDDLKVLLGLPVNTPLVLDERIIVPFTTVFLATDLWLRKPDRQLDRLAAIHDRLPRLEDRKIGGRSLLEVIQGTLPEEQFLEECVTSARPHRSILKDDRAPLEDRNPIELGIRNVARSLIAAHKGYDVDRAQLEVAARYLDQTFDQVVSPPLPGTPAALHSARSATQATNVIGAASRLYDARNALVTQWFQCKDVELRLYRELGVLPFNNWESFHRSLVPVLGAPK